jgi:hypothetical protein
VSRNGGLGVAQERRYFRDIAGSFDLPATCTNGGWQLRTHYQRLLYPFERVKLWGLRDDPLNTGGDPLLVSIDADARCVLGGALSPDNYDSAALHALGAHLLAFWVSFFLSLFSHSI